MIEEDKKDLVNALNQAKKVINDLILRLNLMSEMTQDEIIEDYSTELEFIDKVINYNTLDE